MQLWIHIYFFLPQACWWFFPETTSALRRLSSAAECWSGPPCSAQRAFCPRGSSELGSPRRTRRRCRACGRQTEGWCGPRVLQTTPAPRQNRNLEEEEKRILRMCLHTVVPMNDRMGLLSSPWVLFPSLSCQTDTRSKRQRQSFPKKGAWKWTNLWMTLWIYS